MSPRNIFSAVALLLAVISSNVPATAQTGRASGGSPFWNQYFQEQTQKLTNSSLREIQTLEDWKEHRERYHTQLREMLGLLPWPEKTDLKATITGQTEREGIIAENLHFQALPGLYVTGNLYRPVKQDGPLPAILYVCGHSRAKIDGVSYGPKTRYQHHGVWFAKNGYVCLIIDTIQLGEIEGIHHGTHHLGMWWWHNRGYTPAGVEAWNGIRALDYLQSRSEVDGDRLGMAGRSGGGAYTWWVTALDDRVKAAVPGAGITSTKNHIVDGCIEGHCDCMFQVNSYAWDFPQVAALAAPRAVLISNTDKDSIFPLDGVVDVYLKTRRIYELYGKSDHFGLSIAEGPHKDSQPLRNHAFHWMNRFLTDSDPPIVTLAEKLFTPQELQVFDKLPEDERVTNVHEWFVPQKELEFPESRAQLSEQRKDVVSGLNNTSFRQHQFMDDGLSLNLTLVGEWKVEQRRVRQFNVPVTESQSVPLLVLQKSEKNEAANLALVVCDDGQWSGLTQRLGQEVPELSDLSSNKNDSTADAHSSLKIEALLSHYGSVAFLAPRGVGPSALSEDDVKRTQQLRRLAMLGKTIDSLRVADIVRSVKALKNHHEFADVNIIVRASQDPAAWSLYAGLFLENVERMDLHQVGLDAVREVRLLQSAKVVNPGVVPVLATDNVQLLHLSDLSAEQEASWQDVQEFVKTNKWFDGRLQLDAQGQEARN